MTSPDEVRPLEWPHETSRRLTAGPVSFAPHAGTRLALLVPPDGVALVLVEHEVRAVLMDGSHRLRVAPQGNASPGRANTSLGSNRDPLGGGLPGQEVAPEGCVLLLRRGESISPKGPRLRITDPVRFYNTFLRRCEDLADDALLRVVETLIASRGTEASSALDAVGLELMPHGATSPPTPAMEQSHATVRLDPVHSESGS